MVQSGRDLKMIKLTYELDEKPQTIELEDGTHVIGRKSSCDIVIKEPSVSSQHLRLDVNGGEVVFRDLLSSNGTFHNGKKVQTGTLRSGDRLRLGKLRMLIDGGDSMTLQPLDFAAAPPDADAPAAPPPGGEETPPDASFSADSAMAESAQSVNALVVADSGSKAVAVVRPGEDVSPEEAQRKKLIRYVGGGVAAAAALILIVLMLLPRDNGEPDETDTVPPKIYWRAMSAGAQKFSSQDYKEAYRIWTEWEAKFNRGRSGNPNEPMHVGRTFARVADAYMGLKAGEEDAFGTDWNRLRGAILDVDPELNDTLQEFAVNLEVMCRREANAKKVWDEAERLFKQSEYKEARETYLQIDTNSFYHDLIEPRLKACDDGRRELLDRSIAQADANDDSEEVIRLGNDRIEEFGADPWVVKMVTKHRGQLAQKREFGIIRNMVDHAETMADLEKAVKAIEEFLKRYGSTSEYRLDLAEYSEEARRKIWALKALDLFESGQLAELEKHVAGGKPEWRNEATVQSLVKTARQVANYLAAAREAERKNDVITARNQAQAATGLLNDEANPWYIQATGILQRNPKSKIPKLELENAEQDMRKKRYRTARKHYETAAEYGADISAQIENLEEIGHDLWNKALMDHVNDKINWARYWAHLARDCYAVDHKEYRKITRWLRAHNLEERPRDLPKYDGSQ